MEKVKGSIYAILSAIFFGIMPILARLAYDGGINAFTLVFLRSFFSVLMLLIYLIINKVKFKVTREQIKTLVILSIFGYTFTMITLFMSYNYISVGLATTLHFIYPVVVTLISIVLFKEKIYFSKIIALLLSGIGIYLLIGKDSGDVSIIGTILALVSGIFYSFYLLSVAYSKIKTLNCYVLTFYLSFIASIFLFIVGIFTKQLSFQISAKAWGLSVIIAFLTSIVAVILLQKGIKLIGASTASILSTFEPIVGILLGVLILNETITMRIILGGILVVFSVIILTFKEKNNKKTFKGKVPV
ncbi:DMT family transporter [Oceanirhabdus sp. W0125-5]|uniref:DMT family transporter n=1 Tax=Oceanirhabdus sp. W0125-5 TaxID=2999116 RepID=UPI0022F337AA|nr:DMT family transporter [Oceanirhabdus sp. W0125-5]WBW98351.1 DMT family transporter [Oceanirhabdus sp. W0125-5]